MISQRKVCLRKLGRLFSLIVAKLFQFLPWKINFWLARFLTFLWLDVLGIRREVIADNIRKVFPLISDEDLNRMRRHSMISLCRSFFDVIKIPYLNDDWIEKNVIFEGAGIEPLKSEKNGVFFLSLHIGSGDLAAAIASRKLKPVTIISKRFKNECLDEFWFSLRGRSQTEFINAHAKNNAFEILSALKKKRGVAFVLDQFMGKPYGVETKFFGFTTGTAYGLAVFVKKTERPVYPLYTFWDENHKLHLCVDEPVDLKDYISENNEVITERFNRVLEKIILTHPQHWMWVHKRWKTFE